MTPTRLQQALELIGTECANFMAPASCRTEPGRSKNALHDAHRWCDQCIAAWGLGLGLDEHPPPSPVPVRDHCTWVNVLCPDDLCVLPYGHPFTRRRHHITDTRPGSAEDCTPEERMAYLRDPRVSKWDRRAGYLEARGTPQARLVELGWKMQEQGWIG